MGTNGRRVPLSLSIIESDAFERIEEVAKLHLQSKSPYTIARTLGIKVVEAKAAIAQYEEILRNDADARDLARDHLNTMVARYETLIADANDNLQDLRELDYDEKVGGVINSTIKLIGDLDARRLDALQKAGLLDNNDLADDLAEREEREGIILDMLRNDLCADCQHAIRDKITRLTGIVQGQVVDE